MRSFERAKHRNKHLSEFPQSNRLSLHDPCYNMVIITHRLIQTNEINESTTRII